MCAALISGQYRPGCESWSGSKPPREAGLHARLSSVQALAHGLQLRQLPQQVRSCHLDNLDRLQAAKTRWSAAQLARPEHWSWCA